MNELQLTNNQIQTVPSFEKLLSTPFQNEVNAICLERDLIGDFSEIINSVEFEGNMTSISLEKLKNLNLSSQGEIARETIIKDFTRLKENGSDPTLNIIKKYERDDSLVFFPTDVYSFHVDQSPVPTDTFLCTYYGEASEIIANSQATQKVLIPEFRDKLKKIHTGSDYDFDSFLSEYFFDLHYQSHPNSQPTNLGKGNIWKLATAHPKSNVLPCIHRAPKEKENQSRLLLIC